MLTFIKANIGTIIVALIVAAIVCAIIVKLVKDKKRGKGSCGCGGDCCNCHARCSHSQSTTKINH